MGVDLGVLEREAHLNELIELARGLDPDNVQVLIAVALALVRGRQDGDG